MNHDADDAGGEDALRDTPIRVEWAENTCPSTAIVEAVAAATGHEMTALPPLQDYVDADAVDRLLAAGTNGEGAVRLSFRYDGVDVVAGNGWVEAHADGSGGTGERA